MAAYADDWEVEAANLKLSDEVYWYLRDRDISLPTCVPKWKTPEGNTVPGAKFYEDAVDRVVYEVMPRLMHTQGRWAGQPLKPDPWQIAYVLAPVYGWKAPNDDGRIVRIVRTEYVDVPRKNGKTTLAGAQAIVLLAADGEGGAQVFAAAAGKDQARYCFDPVKAIAEKSPALKKRLKTSVNRINRVGDEGFFAVVSSFADLLHGANVHGAIIDELHVHKTRHLVDALETGTGAREQPLIIIITTADDGRSDTIYAEKRKYCEQLARCVLADPSFYGVVFGADDEADPLDEKTWETANPGIGVSPTRAFLRAEAKKAQNSPANLSRFKRLHCGIRTKQHTAYIDLNEWDRNASIVIESEMKGRDAYGGLDLSAVSDLTALGWILPDNEGGHDVLWRIWMPEAKLRELDERTAGNGTVWVNNGYLRLTPGETVDYGYIKLQIKADSDFLNVREIGYDPWNSSQLVIDLENEGAPMVQVRQGYGTLSSPTKELDRLLKEGATGPPLFRHGGNPCARWQADNFAVAMDPAGNVKPDKNAAGDKIDGIVAAIMGLDRAMRHIPKRKSIYETRGMDVG